MARKKQKRPYGSGCLLKIKHGWAIRWREHKDGMRVMKYETLGDIPKRQALEILADRMRAAREGNSSTPVHFKGHAEKWERDIVPLYKFSTQKGHRWILNTHLIPRFGSMMVPAITAAEIQSWITVLLAKEYAPHTIAHFHEVLSSVLNTAVKWGEISKNPAQCRQAFRRGCFEKQAGKTQK